MQWALFIALCVVVLSGSVLAGITTASPEWRARSVSSLQNAITVTRRASVSNEGVVASSNPIPVTTAAPTGIFSYTAFVHDWVSDLALTDVRASIGVREVLSDPTGTFTVSKLPKGEHELQLSKEGFITQTQRLNLSQVSTLGTTASLVPNLPQLLVQELDGNRDIYEVQVDGTGAKRALPEIEQGERFAPYLSPAGTWLAYTTTQARLRDAGGQPLGQLMLVTRKGETQANLIADLFSYRFEPRWSANGAWLAALGYGDGELKQQKLFLIDVAAKKQQSIIGQVSALTFSVDSLAVFYVRRVGEGVAENGRRSEVIKRVLADGAETILYTQQGAIDTLRIDGDNLLIGSPQLSGAKSWSSLLLSDPAQVTPAAQPVQSDRLKLNNGDEIVLRTAQKGSGYELVRTRVRGADVVLVSGLSELPAASPLQLVGDGAYVVYEQAVQSGKVARFIVGTQGGAVKKIAESIVR